MQNQTNLLSKEKAQKQNRIWVRIASACNNKCVFCLDSDAQNGTFPKEEEIKNYIKKGFKKGYENRVIISGGEASINPKFAEYIKYAKDLGYDRVQTVTNGNMFAIESFCKKVFDAGLEEVTFSFHGHNETLHDYLVATPGAFKKSLKGLIYIKKHYPQIIINIDIVVNKINVAYLPDIVKFFMRLGVYEFDILQIIPFGRGFSQHKENLFYDIGENIEYLTNTWKLSKVNGMYMWTNRFPAEAFEGGFEDLIQDPRKMKSEVMGEAIDMFEDFITSKGRKKPECYGEACDYCFQRGYCYSFLNNLGVNAIDDSKKYLIINGKSTDEINEFKGEYLVLKGEEFPSQVYENFGYDLLNFINYINTITNKQKIINLPKCLGGSGVYENYDDLNPEYNVSDYTKKYINNLYRKKSLNCKSCKYNDSCEGIHINFIRSYSFNILNPVK